MRREVRCRCHDAVLGWEIEEPKDDDSVIDGPPRYSKAGLFGYAHDNLFPSRPSSTGV